MAVRSKTKHRVVLEPRVDNAPTPERRQHSEFRTAGGMSRVVTGVDILRRSGEIEAEAEDAAYRWLCEFVWARHGYFEYRNPRVTDGLRHDAISWNLTRAEAGKRVQMISERMGPRAHVRLEMLLVQELSFSKLGAIIWPNIARQQASSRAQAQCALILSDLPDAYLWVRDQERKDAEERQQKKVLVLV